MNRRTPTLRARCRPGPVLLLSLLAIACAPQPKPTEPSPAVDTSTPSDTTHQGNEMHHGDAALPLPERLAFMSGHVEAGLALYRADEPDMAAPHLLHPVSETHAAEREGLDALGFDGTLFETVSRALDAGRPASEIEPQLAAAEANLALIAQQAPGNPKDIILYLMETLLAEYAIGVPESEVTDPGEYQDAFGFVRVAIQRAEAFDGEAGDRLQKALTALLALWPDAPVPPEVPTSLTIVEQHVQHVRDALAAVEPSN